MGAPRDVGRRPSINLEGSLRNSAVFPHWEQTGVPSVLNASNLYNERTHTEMMREGEKRGARGVWGRVDCGSAFIQFCPPLRVGRN